MLFNDLVIIDESHQILESNATVIQADSVGDFKGVKSDKKHYYMKQLPPKHAKVSTVFLLFDGTSTQPHEVDLVNLVKITNKDVNKYISDTAGIDEKKHDE